MWFKNGLKAQKLLAQGIALGIEAINKSPCRGKSFINWLIFESFCPYRATCLRPYLPRVLPWARSFCPFRAYGVHPGHEGSKSWRVIIIFNPPRIRSLRSRSFSVIKGFRGFKMQIHCVRNWIDRYALFRYIHCFAHNNLMNIMCKVGDYILKINNIAKSQSLCRLSLKFHETIWTMNHC